MASYNGLTDIARIICQSIGIRFIEKVAEGAYKETFHVISQNDYHLALKICKPETSSPREEREISALRKCDHSNIVKLIDVGEYNYEGQNFLYLIEEFLAGGSLSGKLKNGPIPISEVISLGGQLINAIWYLDDLELVHRDIKPDNILFRDQGDTPVLSDFGLVRDLTASSLTETWKDRGPGTAYYAAPEQLNNQQRIIDWWTDQFSLGIVLSICAFGQHPFDYGEDAVSIVVSRIANRKPPSPRFKASVIQTGLTVLEKMLGDWPAVRYRKPLDLLAAWNSQMEA